MPSKKKQKEWTIMVYMAGDNNLAVDMAYNLEQIREVARKGAHLMNLLVYYDGHSPQIPTLFCDFSDPDNPIYAPAHAVPNKLYQAPGGMNENAASRYSLINFVDWCVNKVEVKDGRKRTYGRRAARYALIFSGHSLGFADKGLFKDETSGDAMKIKDLFFALQRITMPREYLEAEWSRHEKKTLMVDTTDLLVGQRLDILGFDSCLMGMFEVGYQFKDLTETMIVSEGSIPSAGWSYAKILASLACDYRKRSTKKVAENFVKEFIQTQDNYIVGGVSVDMAAWDMSKYNELADCVSMFSLSLQNCFHFGSERSLVYRQMERIILAAHWKCQSYMFDQNVDLGDFCFLLKRECESVLDEVGEADEMFTFLIKEVIGSCQNVLDALKKVVILSGFSGGEYQFSNGVALFFPWSLEGYEVTRENYANIWYTQDTTEGGQLEGNGSWDYFLHEYLRYVARRGAAIPTARFSPEPVSTKLGRLKEANSDARYVYSSGINFYQESDFALAGHATKGGGGTTSATSKGGGGTTSATSKGGGGTTSATSKGGGGTTSATSKGGGGTTSASSKGGGGTTSASSKMAGGGSAEAFYETLKLRKNIEIKWNISGFSKQLSEEVDTDY